MSFNEGQRGEGGQEAASFQQLDRFRRAVTRQVGPYQDETRHLVTTSEGPKVVTIVGGRQTNPHHQQYEYSVTSRDPLPEELRSKRRRESNDSPQEGNSTSDALKYERLVFLGELDFGTLEERRLRSRITPHNSYRCTA